MARFEDDSLPPAMPRFLAEGFYWQGRNAKGVQSFTGRSELPPLWAWLGLGLIGIIGLGASLAGGVYWLLHGQLVYSILAAVPSLFWGVLLRGSLWWLDLRRLLPRLSTADALGSQLGTDEAAIQRLAEERGIQPRVNVNGHDYYRPADFGEAATLLRPGEEPDTLLRPASHTPSMPEYLLRATEEE